MINVYQHLQLFFCNISFESSFIYIYMYSSNGNYLRGKQSPQAQTCSIPHQYYQSIFEMKNVFRVHFFPISFAGMTFSGFFLNFINDMIKCIRYHHIQKNACETTPLFFLKCITLFVSASRTLKVTTVLMIILNWPLSKSILVK